MFNRLSRRRALALGAGAGAAALAAPGTRADTTPSEQARPMKTIGVLGGIGPQATMDFEARIHRVSQRTCRADRNAGYPPMVVHYCRHAPFLLTDEGKPQIPLRPDPRILEAARHLGSLADLLVVTSNGAHILREEIERASGRKLVSMIDATLAEVRRRGWESVGVLGLGEPVVYTWPLAELGIECETVDPGPQAALDSAIFRLMEGRDDDATHAAALAAVDSLRDRGVDGVILGCTELPLLLRGHAEASDLINPMQYLAEAALEAALA